MVKSEEAVATLAPRAAEVPPAASMDLGGASAACGRADAPRDLVGGVSGMMGDVLVVCGGQDADGPPISTFKTCYKINVTSANQWTQIADFPDYVSYAGVATDSVSGTMYVLGGVKAHYDGPMPTQWIYSDKIYRWEEDRAVSRKYY